MFTQNAIRLSGLAGALLGWRPNEFWAATPAELGSVLAAFAPDMTHPADHALITILKEQFPDG
jgi:Phage tail assembly chaperone protein, TAC